MTQLSVVIPTLNEAELLPHLLDALNAQTRVPDEIIVADAGSQDTTVALAHARNARVVRGGMPGPGRNAGARVAQGDILLFLDADVLPHPDFIERALDEFEHEGYAVATCPIEAISTEISDKVLIDATNLYIQLITPISPRAPGFCIFVRRMIHQTIDGFDETLKMSEDHDYVRRASKHGRFGLLTSTHIPVSMRRLEKEGIVGLAFKYLWCEMHALSGKPIRSMPFEYEFGAFQSVTSEKRRWFLNVRKLRTLSRRLKNPIIRMSRIGRERLHRLVEFDPANITGVSLRTLLERQDLDLLEHYVQERLAIMREHTGLSLRFAGIKNLPDEIIQAMDVIWIQPPFPYAGRSDDRDTDY